MEDALFVEQRIHPRLYEVMFRGKLERTVSIRGGVAWPQAGIPGYFVLVAQLEEKALDQDWRSRDVDPERRLLVFHEDQATLMGNLCKKIEIACSRWRIDSVCHGDEAGEESFGIQLWECLRKLRAGAGREIIQHPQVYKSFRCKDLDFLPQLVRGKIANKTLLLFQSGDGHTPVLNDMLRNADTGSSILDIPELKALAHAIDDFDVEPWRPPQAPAKETGSAWAV